MAKKKINVLRLKNNIMRAAVRCGYSRVFVSEAALKALAGEVNNGTTIFAPMDGEIDIMHRVKVFVETNLVGENVAI
jgi:hypothetical protein